MSAKVKITCAHCGSEITKEPVAFLDPYTFCDLNCANNFKPEVLTLNKLKALRNILIPTK